MEMKRHNLQDSLKNIGKPGELLLEKRCPFIKRLTADNTTYRGTDFRTEHKDGFELKTEDWRMGEFSWATKTSPNFFIERLSAEKTNTPGGPWQARGKNSKYYSHLFFHEEILFVFKTDDIIKSMEMLEANHSLPPVRRVLNDGYMTTGYNVSRSKLLSITSHRVFDLKKPADIDALKEYLLQ